MSDWKNHPAFLAFSGSNVKKNTNPNDRQMGDSLKAKQEAAADTKYTGSEAGKG